jgi:DNA-binding MarR family transcriptional regulator
VSNNELDEVIHQRARLGLMSALLASPQQEAEFNILKERLGLTDGNLSTHLSVLEQHGYVSIEKAFVGKKPKTWVRLTEAGAAAFQRYVTALEAIIRPQLAAIEQAEEAEEERNREMAAQAAKRQVRALPGS